MQNHIKDDIPVKDTHEIQNYARQSLLNILVTTGVANVAPFLALAKAVDASASIGFATISRVEDVKMIPQQGYNILRVHISIETISGQTKNVSECIIYTFRNMSTPTFEPFVFIPGDGGGVFAYANDAEFLMEKIDGDEITVLKKIYEKALENNLLSLGRYVDLLMSKN
jgi:hypothetical protein